jgi:hypothetical protein
LPRLPRQAIADRQAVARTAGISGRSCRAGGSYSRLGLRGGVALALALALPEALAERALLVALTGGVVLATS